MQSVHVNRQRSLVSRSRLINLQKIRIIIHLILVLVEIAVQTAVETAVETEVAKYIRTRISTAAFKRLQIENLRFGLQQKKSKEPLESKQND